MAHTVAGHGSYFPAIMLSEQYAPGPYAQLQRKKVLGQKWPAGMAFMSKANVTKIMREVRHGVKDCTLELGDLKNDLRRAYYRYFANLNEPAMPPEKIRAVVAAMTKDVITQVKKSRVLYMKQRAVFLRAISGAPVVARLPINERTKDTTLYAHPPNMVPQLQADYPGDGSFAVMRTDRGKARPGMRFAADRGGLPF